MSTALSAPPSAGSSIAQWTTEAEACVRKIFEGAFGPGAFAISAPDTSPEPADSIWAAYDFQPVSARTAFGTAAFGMPRDAAVALGHRILATKHRASEHDHHAIYAIHHLLGQIATGLAAAFTLSSAESPEAEEPLPDSQAFALAISEEGGSTHSLFVRVSNGLLAALSQGAPAELPAATLGTSTQALAPARNLDLLLDVEMPVSISFGTTRLALKDVAKLGCGSTIELDRALSEPVEVLVNNHSIARGQVVVVDGKFAVRIQDIISKQDRLRSCA